MAPHARVAHSLFIEHLWAASSYVQHSDDGHGVTTAGVGSSGRVAAGVVAAGVVAAGVSF